MSKEELYPIHISEADLWFICEVGCYDGITSDKDAAVWEAYCATDENMSVDEWCETLEKDAEGLVIIPAPEKKNEH